MKYSLATLAYVFALLAAGMAAFGFAGLFASVAILGVWALVARGSTLLKRVATALTGAAALFIIGSIGTAIPAAIDAARTSACLGRLAQLRLAIRNHEVATGSLPQAIVSAADGTAMHSWRMLIVPFLESNGWFRQYKHAQPWNSPANAKLLAGRPMDFYQCPSHADGTATTHYLAVVDPRTAWPPDRGRRLNEFPDGAANTLLLIEAPHVGVPWAKPQDLSFDEAVQLLSGDAPPHGAPHSVAKGLYRRSDRLNVAFVDGRAETLYLPLPRATAIAMLTAAGGEEFYHEQLPAEGVARLDYTKCYALAVFLALAAAPGIKLLRRRSLVSSATNQQDLVPRGE